MDLSKYPIHKLFHLIAGIIPGFTALFIFELAKPGAFEWFFSLGSIGYRTRLSLILIASFIVGYTLTKFFSAFLGGLGGVLGAYYARKPYKPPHSFMVAPWRDRRWRTALKNVLGADAPNDTQLMSKEVFELRRRTAEQFPNTLTTTALADLNLEKLNLEIDDGKWEQWYDYYHNIVLLSENPDISFQVQTGLNFSLEVTGLCILFSALFVPEVRHWWCITPACGWVFMLVAEVYAQLKKSLNKWLSLSQQIEYLSKSHSGSEVSKGMAAS